jgi:hypothetical protein
MSPPVKLRKLSVLEKLYVVNQDVSEFSAIQVVLDAQLDHINVEALAENIRELDGQLGLGRFTIKGAHWQRTNGGKIFVEVVDGPFPGLTDPRLKRRFDLAKGLAEFVIYHSGTSVQILFRAHHALMDGVGLLNVLYDFGRVLRGESATSKLYLRSEEEIHAALQVKLDKRKEKWKGLETGRRFSWSSPANTQLIHMENTGRHYISSLVESISTSFKCPWSVMIPANLRRFADAHNEVSNLSAPVFIESHTCKGSFREELKVRLRNREFHLKPKLYPLLDSLPLWFLRPILKLFQLYSHISNTFYTSACISSLGTVELVDFSSENFKVVDIYPLPTSGTQEPLAVVILDHENGVRAAVSQPNWYASTLWFEAVNKALKSQ